MSSHLEFPVPKEAYSPREESPEHVPAQPVSPNAAEPAPKTPETPQLIDEMLHIGNFLEADRKQELANPREGTVFSGLRRIFGQQKKRNSWNSLIREELRATSGMFAEETPNRRFDFFYYGTVPDNSHEWIFHEWNKQGKDWKSSTTRYLIQPRTVYRSQEGQRYTAIPGQEVTRLWEAVNKYYTNVKKTIYS